MKMEMEKKRVFVGNLPPHTTEDEVTSKFCIFGKVLSVEIKQRQNGSTFAYLDLQINSRDLQFCFRDIPKTWDGYQIKLELAKESFLNRLEKERQVNLQSDIRNENKLEKERQQVNLQSDVMDEDKQIQSKKRKSENVVSKRSSKISTPEVFNEDCYSNHANEIVTSSEEDEPQFNRKLPMFGGTNIVLSDSEHIETKLKNVDNGNMFSFVTPRVEKAHLQKKKVCASAQKGSLSLQNNQVLENNIKKMQKKKQKANDINNEFSNQCSVKKNKNGVKDNHKNAIAEEKRLKSVEDRKNVILHQKEIVKLALASLDSNVKPNRKIVFDMDEEDSTQIYDSESSPNLNDSTKNKSKKKSTRIKDVAKPSLFKIEESEDENDHFKIKSQFEGKKGQKLLELQTRYGNDKRFSLDNRFYESDDDTIEIKTEVVSGQNEMERQLGILQNILGHEVYQPKENEAKQKTKSMLRFDPIKPDHLKYEIIQQMDSLSQKELVTKQEEPSAEIITRQSASKSNNIAKPVSKEKFYKVTDHLKETLQKKNEKTVFSLLDMFGPSNDGCKGIDKTENEKYAYKNTVMSKKAIGWTRNPFKHDSSESEEEKEEMEFSKPVTDSLPPQQHGVWQESFFFKSNDIRLQEGIKFFTKIHVEESHFSEKRRELKKIFKSKIKNNQINATKWKNKFGGKKSNKKFRKAQ